jgi:ABC-type antimicrobial peptide transport system permease subunit
MLTNYFLVAWRNLVRNKLSSFVNIASLAIGLAMSILIYIWIDNTLSYNRFNLHYQEIYQLMKTQRGNGQVSTGSSVPGLLADAIHTAIPKVKYAARGAFGGALLNYQDKSLDQHSLYTDPEFFRIMTYQALQGDPIKALADPSSVVLTETAARKLFGGEPAMGKTVSLDHKYQLKVAAVISDPPTTSSYRFEIVLPFKLFEKDNAWLTKWDDNRILTWVLLPTGTPVAKVNDQMTSLIREKANDPQIELFAYPLRDVWLRSGFQNGHPSGGRINIVYMMGLAGMLILLLACVNFMNLATARSIRRSREVGVRKTLGALRAQLIGQFLGEAFLLTVLAMLLGILLARLLFPLFNSVLFGGSLSFDLVSAKAWTFLSALGLFTALVAGSYPAFFLSRFRPVLVLKGIFSQAGKGSMFRKGLVVFQFTITIFLLVAIIVVIQQMKYGEERPIGYDQENLVDVTIRGPMQDKTALASELLQKIPGITAVAAGAENLVRFNAGNNGIQWPGWRADQDFYVIVSTVGYDWVRTAGLKMAEGREFDRSYRTDSSAVLVNEAAVRKMGLKEPVIGTRLDNRPIVGVIKDFVFNDAFSDPLPLMLNFGNKGLSHLFIRIRNNEHWQGTIAQVEKSIKKLNPGYPFEFHFTTEEYQYQFNGVRSTVYALDCLGIFAILISCLGLFGLSAFMAEQRTKEIGIRKILGAGTPRIWYGLSRDFLKPVLIAFPLGASLAGWTMHSMLQNLDYRVALSWWMFALAGALAVLIALTTVTWQAVRAAMANPVKALRAE